jgi:hypothetical protein
MCRCLALMHQYGPWEPARGICMYVHMHVSVMIIVASINCLLRQYSLSHAVKVKLLWTQVGKHLCIIPNSCIRDWITWSRAGRWWSARGSKRICSMWPKHVFFWSGWSRDCSHFVERCTTRPCAHVLDSRSRALFDVNKFEQLYSIYTGVIVPRTTHAQFIKLLKKTKRSICHLSIYIWRVFSIPENKFVTQPVMRARAHTLAHTPTSLTRPLSEGLRIHALHTHRTHAHTHTHGHGHG